MLPRSWRPDPYRASLCYDVCGQVVARLAAYDAAVTAAAGTNEVSPAVPREVCLVDSKHGFRPGIDGGRDW